MIRRFRFGCFLISASLLAEAGTAHAAFTITVTAFDFTASGLNAAQQTLAQDLFVSAENSWLGSVAAPLGQTEAVTIAKVVLSNAIASNGVTKNAVADANGLPSKVGEIDISSDTTRMFYGATVGTGLDASHRDAYSTMLHEIGHAIGFNFLAGGDGYQEWNDRVTGNKFLLSDGTTKVTLAGTDANGASHVDDATYPGDLMKTTGTNGVRDSISTLDVQILTAAFGNVAVPEPSSVILTGLGLLGLMSVARRRVRIAA